AGAMEGTVLGIASFALSQSYGQGNRDNPRWECSRTHAPNIIRKVLEAGMPKDVLVNVNFPDCAPDAVQGIAVCAQGKRDQETLRIDARFDGRGNPYYWVAYKRSGFGATRAGTDLVAVAEKKIAVTPLRLDTTDELFMTALSDVFD